MKIYACASLDEWARIERAGFVDVTDRRGNIKDPQHVHMTGVWFVEVPAPGGLSQYVEIEIEVDEESIAQYEVPNWTEFQRRHAIREWAIPAAIANTYQRTITVRHDGDPS